MSKTNTTIDIAGIDDDTIAMRFAMEHQMFLDGHRDAAHEAFLALEPFMNDITKFLTELNKWVHVVKSVDDDEFDRMHDDDLTIFDLHDTERFF